MTVIHVHVVVWVVTLSVDDKSGPAVNHRIYIGPSVVYKRLAIAVDCGFLVVDRLHCLWSLLLIDPCSLIILRMPKKEINRVKENDHCQKAEEALAEIKRDHLNISYAGRPRNPKIIKQVTVHPVFCRSRNRVSFLGCDMLHLSLPVWAHARAYPVSSFFGYSPEPPSQKAKDLLKQYVFTVQLMQRIFISFLWDKNANLHRLGKWSDVSHSKSLESYARRKQRCVELMRLLEQEVDQNP